MAKADSPHCQGLPAPWIFILRVEEMDQGYCFMEGGCGLCDLPGDFRCPAYFPKLDTVLGPESTSRWVTGHSE